LCWFFNGSDSLVVTGRDKDATWCMASAALDELGWPWLRLRDELLAKRWSYRTYPPGDEIDWGDSTLRFDRAESTVTILDRHPAKPGVRGFYKTVAVEVLPPTDAEAPSHPAHTPKATTVSDSARWAIIATHNLRAENKVRKDTTQADLARLLEAEAKKAVKAGQISRALKASYIENQLAPWGIWPLNSFK
jgi:hypothetical protein